MLKRKLLARKQASDVAAETLETNSGHTSPYFAQPVTIMITNQPSIPLWQLFYTIECRLNQQLNSLVFNSSLVAAVYNPIEYASHMHCQYLERFLRKRPNVLFIGINPGPWGMCQTGIPFGCVAIVRDWMQINADIEKPTVELSVRPVTGLSCLREEPSGKKFWTLMRDIFHDNPDTFAAHNFVHNLCPLAFFAASGRNITPPELKGDVKRDLLRLCNIALLEIIDLLAPNRIVSVGRFVEGRVKTALKTGSHTIDHLRLPHPSPRSLNNSNWTATAKEFLIQNNICN